MKTGKLLLLFFVCMAFLTQASFSQQTLKPSRSTGKTPSSKPASEERKTVPSSASRQSRTNTKSAPQQVDRTAIKPTKLDGDRPVQGGNNAGNKPGNVPNQSAEGPSFRMEVGAKKISQGINLNTACSNFWEGKNVYNCREARKQMRHCGCGAEIVFVNNTSDTLDMYFSYIEQSQTPSIDGVVLPPIKNNRMLSNFYIVPLDSAR